MNTRIFGLDLLRCYAIILVVFFHGRDGNLPDIFRVLFAQGYIGVNVFFVLSAWLVAAPLVRALRDYNQVDAVRFWVMRYGKTLPPLFAVLVLVALLQVVGVSNLFTHAPTRVEDWWLIVTFRHNYIDIPPFPLPMLWSLAVEEQFYLVLPLVFAVLLGKKRGVWVVVALTTIVGSVASRFLAEGWYTPLGPRPFEHQLVEFTFGTALVAAKEYQTEAWKALVKYKRWCAVSGAALLVTVQTHTSARDQTFIHVVPLIVAIAVCLLLPALDTWRVQNRFVGWPVETLAKGTYAVYLTHIFAIAAAQRLVDRGFARQAAVVVFIGVLAFTLYRFVEVFFTDRRKRLLTKVRQLLRQQPQF